VDQTFFVFYRDNIDKTLHYKYGSPIGWSEDIDTGSSVTDGWKFSICFDGSKVSYALIAVPTPQGIQTSPIMYRRGTPLRSGLILWDTPEQEVLTLYRSSIVFLNIAVDSLGFPYIAYTNETGYDCTKSIIKSEFNNGTWSTEIGYPINLGETIHAGYAEIILPLRNEKMFCAYSDYLPKKYHCWEYNGTWHNVDSLIDVKFAVSMVSVGDQIHALYHKENGQVAYKNRTYGNNWSNEMIFYNQSAMDNVAIGKSGKNLISFWCSTNGTLFYKRFLNNQWQDNVAYLTISEPNSASLNCPYEYEQDTIVIWMNFDGSYRLLSSFIDLNEGFFSPLQVTVIVVFSIFSIVVVILIYKYRKKLGVK